jgi:glycosyltransferase involved in cell wall biosynthesis
MRLIYLVSHPIQYQAPLLRRIAAEPGFDLRVLFERIDPDHRYFDTGFGRDVSWDVDLTGGYDHVAATDTDLSSEIGRSDVVWLHGWQTPFMRRALKIAASAGKPVLMRGENCDLAMPDGPGVKGWLKRRYISGIFRRCDGFLAIGTANRQYYLRRGVEERRIFSMPYAIDNDAFSAIARDRRKDRDTLRKALGIAPSQKVILFAGKFERRKKPDLLAEAVQCNDWGSQAPALVYVGDGEMREQLKAQVPDARFPGFVNQGDLPAYYDLADVFVLPSEREPWGLAVNEAMACGTAVVVSDQVGCAPDLVDGRSGLVFPTGDAAALGLALETCLDRSDEMGKHALDRIRGWSFEQDVEGLTQAVSAVADVQ